MSCMPPCCWHKISPVFYCLWCGVTLLLLIVSRCLLYQLSIVTIGKAFTVTVYIQHYSEPTKRVHIFVKITVNCYQPMDVNVSVK